MKIYISKQIVLSKGEEIYKSIGSFSSGFLLFNSVSLSLRTWEFNLLKYEFYKYEEGIRKNKDILFCLE